MIIVNELKLFERQLGRIMVEPLISKICRKMDKIREKELKRVFGKIKEENERKRVVIERFSRELVERMLQVPLEKLREAVLNNDDELLYAAKKLFGIRVEKEE